MTLLAAFKPTVAAVPATLARTASSWRLTSYSPSTARSPSLLLSLFSASVTAWSPSRSTTLRFALHLAPPPFPPSPPRRVSTYITEGACVVGRPLFRLSRTQLSFKLLKPLSPFFDISFLFVVGSPNQLSHTAKPTTTDRTTRQQTSVTASTSYRHLHLTFLWQSVS